MREQESNETPHGDQPTTVQKPGGCGAESERKQGRHQAANPESDDGGRGAGEDRDNEHRDEKHRAILSPPGRRVFVADQLCRI